MSFFEKDPFRSRRLIFRSIESPGDDDFFHALQADPVSFMNSTPSLVAPASHKYTQNTREHYQEKSLLGVLICLPSTPENRALAGLPEKEPEDTKKPSPPQSMIRVEQQDKGIPIGAMALASPQSGPRYMHHRCADIGIDIAPKYQRRGYGEEALQWCLGWGFEYAGLHRIGIRVLGWNEGAFRLYQRIGFVVESRERERWWSNGRWWDDIGLGMLETEWRARYQGKDSGSREVTTEEILQ